MFLQIFVLNILDIFLVFVHSDIHSCIHVPLFHIHHNYREYLSYHFWFQITSSSLIAKWLVGTDFLLCFEAVWLKDPVKMTVFFQFQRTTKNLNLKIRLKVKTTLTIKMKWRHPKTDDNLNLHGCHNFLHHINFWCYHDF